MKKQTREWAWIFMILNAISVLTLRSIPAENLGFPYIGVRITSESAIVFNNWIFSIPLLIGWIFLLIGRKWAWYMLVAVYALALGKSLYEVFVYPEIAYILPSFPYGSSIWSLVISGTLPLLILLSDMPSHWNRILARET